MSIQQSFLDYCPPVDDGLDILFQDKHLLVVNKPPGLLTTPGRGADKQDCLVSRAQQHFATAQAVHRLDMATSGLVILALDSAIHRDLSIQFQQRQVEKRYVAVVDGLLALAAGEQGQVDLPLMTDWPNRPRQMVDAENGKPALTLYQMINQDRQADTSRLALTPVTGRTHQLRVHMQVIGHPIVGDNLYGKSHDVSSTSRLMLHACSLRFIHPVTAQYLSLASEPAF